MMVASDAISDLLGISRFIETRLMEADGKSMNLARRHMRRRHGQYTAAVDAAAQQNAQWDVAHETTTYGLCEQMPQLLGQTVLIALCKRLVGLDVEPPIVLSRYCKVV